MRSPGVKLVTRQAGPCICGAPRPAPGERCPPCRAKQQAEARAKARQQTADRAAERARLAGLVVREPRPLVVGDSPGVDHFGWAAGYDAALTHSAFGDPKASVR